MKLVTFQRDMYPLFYSSPKTQTHHYSTTSVLSLKSQSYSSSTLHSVKKHSASFQEFTHFLSQDKGRYAKESEGFIWVTSSPYLQKVMKNNFADISKTFNIQKNLNPPIRKSIRVTPVTNDKHKDLPAIANVSAGGFPALWSAFLQSILFKEGFFGNQVAAPVYIMPPNLKSSAAFGSSTQFHVSHAGPMYTDAEFSTVNILKKTIKRTFYKESPEKDNYMIGEISPYALLDPEVVKVGLGYLYHELKYKTQSLFGFDTILEETVPLAIASGRIMDNATAEVGQSVLLRRDTVRVAYNEAETKELQELQAYLKKYGIEASMLSLEEAEKITGSRPSIGEGGSVWAIKGDGNVVPNIVELLVQGIERNGGKVIEGWLEQVFYDESNRRVCAVGVVSQNAEARTSTLIKTNNLFTSFGALARYTSEGYIKDFRPVESIIPGTGFSGFLLVEGEIIKPIDSNNSHFTPLKTETLEDGKKVTLIKATCGGAIGTTQFCKDHAINNLYYAANIVFPGKKIEIISAKSCSRPLNAKNSVTLQEVVPGFWAGTGFGGKGITDAPGFALKYVAPKLTEQFIAPPKINSFIERYLKSSSDLTPGKS